MVLEKTPECPLDSKEIKPVSLKGDLPEYSLKGLMLKLQYFGHLIQQMTHWKNPCYWEKLRAEGKRGYQRTSWPNGITNAINMDLGKPQKKVRDREAWPAAVHRVAKSQT